MKGTIKAILLLAAFSAIAISACKKDDEKSAEENLTAKACWKQSKAETFNPLTNAWEADTIEDCDKDDCVKFNSDKTLTFDEGATKCDPADPQTGTGAWTLSTDGKTLTFNDSASGLTFSGTVIELSESKLVLEIVAFGFKIRYTWQ